MPAQQAVFEARQRYRQRDDLLLLAATYWLLGGKPDLVDPTIAQQQMGHACEWETSMILHLAPHLVGDVERDRAGLAGHAIRARDPGLDHPGTDRARSHRRPPSRDRSQRRDPLSHFLPVMSSPSWNG